MFTTNNVLRGETYSRRDDIESAMLLLIFLLNDSKLPWSSLSKKFTAQNMESFVFERLRPIYTQKLYNMVPKILRDCLMTV